MGLFFCVYWVKFNANSRLFLLVADGSKKLTGLLAEVVQRQLKEKRLNQDDLEVVLIKSDVLGLIGGQNQLILMPFSFEA